MNKDNKFKILDTNPTLSGAIFDIDLIAKTFPPNSLCWVLDDISAFNRFRIYEAIVGNGRTNYKDYGLLFKTKTSPVYYNPKKIPERYLEPIHYVIRNFYTEVTEKIIDEKGRVSYHGRDAFRLFRSREEAELYLIRKSENEEQGILDYAENIALLREKYSLSRKEVPIYKEIDTRRSIDLSSLIVTVD